MPETADPCFSEAEQWLNNRGGRRLDSCINSHSVKNNPAPIAKGKRILVVDDDPELGEALAEVLVDEGYSVGCAGNSAQALDALASTSTDVVLLDLNMPIMNGYEFLDRRAADPTLARIPVIIMSASVGRPDNTVGTTVLGKPIDVEALLAMLGG